MNFDQRFAHIDGERNFVTGVNWDRLGQSLEEIHRFNDFDFESSGFKLLVETAPQKLVVKEGGGLK